MSSVAPAIPGTVAPAPGVPAQQTIIIKNNDSYYEDSLEYKMKNQKFGMFPQVKINQRTNCKDLKEQL